MLLLQTRNDRVFGGILGVHTCVTVTFFDHGYRLRVDLPECTLHTISSHAGTLMIPTNVTTNPRWILAAFPEVLLFLSLYFTFALVFPRVYSSWSRTSCLGPAVNPKSRITSYFYTSAAHDTPYVGNIHEFSPMWVLVSFFRC